MEKYWALDYVDELECELVVDNQLYATEEEAAAAKLQKPDPEHYEVNWYTISDIEEAWGYAVVIEDGLYVNALEQ